MMSSRELDQEGHPVETYARRSMDVVPRRRLDKDGLLCGIVPPCGYLEGGKSQAQCRAFNLDTPHRHHLPRFFFFLGV